MYSRLPEPRCPCLLAKVVLVRKCFFPQKWNLCDNYNNWNISWLTFFVCFLHKKQHECLYNLQGRRGRDRMVVGFTTTYAISAYHHWCCEFESRSGLGVQHYMMKFVSDLRQVGGFLRLLWFPPPIKLTTMI